MILQKSLYYLTKKTKAVIHKGEDVHCPVCGFESKDFYPIGRNFPVISEYDIVGSGRRFAGCHKCDSTDRERLVYLFLKDNLNLFKKNRSNYKILHIAPEKNIANIILENEFQHYICGDLFTEGYNYPNHVLKMDVTDLYFKNNYFDLIICNHVLEHVPKDAEAMKELFRVLKPEGVAILQVPISTSLTITFEDFSIVDPREREVNFGQSGHVRIYGQDYLNKLNQVGFKTKAHSLATSYKKYGLNKEEKIFVGRK